MKYKESRILPAYGCAKAGNTLFFLGKDINIVFKKEIGKEETKLFQGPPEGNVLAPQMASRIILWKDELIYIPWRAGAIWFSDLDLQNWGKVEYENRLKERISNAALQAVLYGERLFIIGADYPAMICLDLNSKKITYIREPYQRPIREKKKQRDIFFRKDYVLKDGFLYLASCLDNYVLKMNLDTFSFEWKEVGSRANKYSGIAWDGEYFWLSPRTNTPVVKWDGKNCTEEISLPDGFKNPRTLFHGIVYTGEILLLPGKNQPNSLIVYPETGNLSVTEGQYWFYQRLNGDEFLAQRTDGQMQLIHDKNENQSFFCRISSDAFMQFIQENHGDYGSYFKQVRKENTLIGLEEMLEIFCGSL